ncbi:FliH/SctL family protein [Sphingomonas sp. BAUL-RG-20F-R05-02]|uniref:FliH/SctL family protein n=1 Tax=Sphingomonas sp. BAUL-RG-20F-R05-02 TaxID=2914830 RepID=UPI001F55C6DB|nr:FliH/SctL family protein [Sphingomonas sp. BAUL-RG-20F-R05-02]
MMADMSFQARPFAFDRVFAIAEPDLSGSAGELALRLAAAEAQLAALRADHAAALATAYAEAFEAGLREGRQERDTALLSAADALQAGIEDIAERHGAVLDGLAQDAAEVALAAADMLAGHAVALAPVQAIDDAIARVLGQVARGQEVVIRVHPDLVTDIEARIADRQSRDRRRLALVVIEDITLAPGDAQIAWDSGGVVLDAAARRAAVLAELAPLLGA